MRKGDNPIDSLLQQTTGQVSACAQATKGVVTLHKYYGELSCLLEAYSRATPLVMPPPTMETWVLEGSLEPFVHYVPVQRDWSDLEARLAWAEAHPAAAANISAHARAHVLKTLGASAASERRVVMAVLRGYRQALACAQSA